LAPDCLRHVRFFAAAALLSLAASPAAAQSLVGFWLGRGQPGDDGVVYVTEIRADGTFISEFRRYEGCRIVEKNVESGTWAVNGNVEEMITTNVNGRPVSFGNTYTIELLTETEQRARLQKNGHLFIERRLAKFEFPPCQDGA
jgi:hypothetical protein